jgi:dipeptidyl aminopeptidase/acylaminoacyl peptidase
MIRGHHVAAALVSAALLLPVAEGADSIARKPKQYTIEQFMTSVEVNSASFSPDESEILFWSNESGVRNVYTVPVTGGKARALTASQETTEAVSYFPEDRRVLYTRDKGGDENDHLYVRELDGSERDLTPGDKLKADFVRWSGDNKSFYIATNERNPKFFDLYRLDAKTYDRTLVYKDETGYEIDALSDDGRWLALGKPNTTSDRDLYLHDLKTGTTKHLSVHQGVASYTGADFDPQSKWLYYLTDDGGEFTRVRRIELASGRSEDVEKADWDVLETEISDRGKYRVTRINADANTVVRLYDNATGREVPMPRLEGDITAVVISPSEKRMAFYLRTDRAPRNLYVYDFGTKKLTRLTDTLNSQINPEDLVESNVVRFKSFDGMVIPGIMYKPLTATPANKVPAVLMVHGGPGGQAREGYNALAQYLANHGYVVYDINNRGSSGYGRTFFMADDRKHGREPLWDCVEAKKFLAAQPYVDGERIGIMGGSYGGYMVAAALAFQPEVFAVGVDIFGVTNWVRTLQVIPPYWESFRKALYDEIGDPNTELDRLKATSPLFHADKIRKPLLVVQGKNDPRVIKAESDEIVEAVRKNGVPVEYLVFDDEGHGFSKKKNQIAAYGTIQKFLDNYLKGAAKDAVAAPVAH